MDELLIRQGHRTKGHRVYANILKIIAWKPKFIFLGGEIEDGSIILSNHVGMKAPVTLEAYFKKKMRFWGTYEMNSGLKSVYKYLSTTYFHDKKHKPKFLAKIIGFIGSPFANGFYKGMNLISTYRDTRFKSTLVESIKTLQENTTLVIFPEDSHDGYHDTLTKFYPGFLMLSEQMFRRGKDTKIYLSYLNKKKHQYVFSKPYMYSELVAEYPDREELCKVLCDKTNELRYYKKEKSRK